MISMRKPTDDYTDAERCPVCGQPADYCQGHGESGDPEGFRRMEAHGNGIHFLCDMRGCDESAELWRGLDAARVDLDTLGDIVRTYLNTILWQSDCNGMATHEDCRGEDCDTGMDDVYDVDDFGPDTVAEVTAEIAGLIAAHPLAFRIWRNAFDGTDQWAHDFALTRNGHGAGFWDRFYTHGEPTTDAQRVNAVRAAVGDYWTDLVQPYGTSNAVEAQGSLVLE